MIQTVVVGDLDVKELVSANFAPFAALLFIETVFASFEELSAIFTNLPMAVRIGIPTVRNVQPVINVVIIRGDFRHALFAHRFYAALCA